MRDRVTESPEEFLEHLETAKPGDTLIFDESGSTTSRRVQAVDFKKLLHLERER